jgi:hypothetical protein
MREILSLKRPFGSIPLPPKTKRADLSVNPLFFLGGAEGDRTPDPKTASLVLSQLSYSPILPRYKVTNVTSRFIVVKKKDSGFPWKY